MSRAGQLSPYLGISLEVSGLPLSAAFTKGLRARRQAEHQISPGSVSYRFPLSCGCLYQTTSISSFNTQRPKSPQLRINGSHLGFQSFAITLHVG